MKRALLLTFALTTGLAALAGYPRTGWTETPARTINRGDSPAAVRLINYQAGAQPAPAALFREGQQVVVVGEITSSPKKIAGVAEEQKMQVAVGPAKIDYTLHLKGAPLIGASGQKIEDNDLIDKMWVRAEGTVMDDPRRIKVTKLQVIGKDMPGLKQSAFYRPGFDQGYVMAVAGTRQILPATPGAIYTPAATVIVGKVSDDTGSLETTRKIQVDAAGNTWTLHVPKDVPILNAKGEKISVHEISESQWVRAHGWQTDDLRLRVARIENIGPEEAYRASTYFRTGEPIGYVVREPGAGARFTPFKITGVITAVDEANGAYTIKDDQGAERVIYSETVTFYVNDRPADVKTLQKGQRVTVLGSEIGF